MDTKAHIKKLVHHYQLHNIEILSSLITDMKASTTAEQAISTLLCNLPSVVNCHNGQMIILDPNFLKNERFTILTALKVIVDGKFVDMVAISESDIDAPAYDRVADGKRMFQTPRFVSVPIAKEDGKTQFTL